MTLSYVLNSLISQTLKDKQPHGHVCKGGLHIHVELTDEATIKLQLRRQRIYPSLSEWEIVMRSFPWPCRITPVRDTNYTLTARIPVHHKMLL